MSNKSADYIKLAVVYIKNGDVQKLDKMLNIMPLEQLGDNSDALLSLFLSTCAANNQPEAVKVVLLHWSAIYPETEKIPILSQLFLVGQLNVSTLAFAVLSHDDYTYVELMSDLMKMDSSPGIITACNKADQIFGEQSYNTYKTIAEAASETGNYRVEEYALTNMEEHAPYREKPEWVKNFYDVSIPKETELYNVNTGDIKFILPNDQESVIF
jgi:hypothetical protein